MRRIKNTGKSLGVFFFFNPEEHKFSRGYDYDYVGILSPVRGISTVLRDENLSNIHIPNPFQALCLDMKLEITGLIYFPRIHLVSPSDIC